LQHHADFCPAGEGRGIGRGESRAGIEGQKEIIHEIGRPRGIAPLLGQHLGEKKRAFHAAGGEVAALRTSGIELPVPESEHQNVGDPECASRAQQNRRWLAMVRNPLNEKNQRSNEGKSDYAASGKGKNPGYVVTAAVVRHHRGDHQNEDDGWQQPTWTHRKLLRQRQIHAGGSQHRYKGGPAWFTDDLAGGHEGEVKSARVEFSTVSWRLKSHYRFFRRAEEAPPE